MRLSCIEAYEEHDQSYKHQVYGPDLDASARVLLISATAGGDQP